jgi:alanine racemase
MPEPPTAWISTSAICRNVGALRGCLPAGTPLCVAVKADAYGHGLEQVLPALRQAGVERLAVASLEEACDLRARGWAKPLLSLGPVLAVNTDRQRAERAAEAVAGNIACTVTTTDEARILAQAARRQHRIARVEIQVDTGMGRCGALWDKALDLVSAVASIEAICIDGVYMHFATSDEADLSFARLQLDRFIALRRQIIDLRLPVRAFHAANSAAIFRLPDSHFDLARPGLSIYGYWGGPEKERPPDLRPAMRVTARLTEVRLLASGSTVGYGCTWTAKRDSLIGTVSLGYADGYRRLLGGRAVVTLPEAASRPSVTIPVVGRVSMDQINLDLTDVPNLGVGDEVVAIDDNPSLPNSIESLARLAGTIPYEITTLIGPRVKRLSAA